MLIGGKAAYIPKQLKQLSNANCRNFEMHMFHNDPWDIKSKEACKLLKSLNLSCYCMHTPYANKYKTAVAIGTNNIDEIEFMKDYIKKTIILAEDICDVKNPIIVTHLGYAIPFNTLDNSVDLEIERKLAINRAKDFIGEIVESIGTRRILAIENVHPFERVNGNLYHTVFGDGLDVVELLESLQLPCNVGSVLDTCHAIMSINANKLSRNNFIDISSYIEGYSNSCKLIHLADSINLGMDINTHAQPFQDICVLKHILEQLKLYDYDVPITLEVLESDNKYSNYTKMLSMITSSQGISTDPFN